MKITLFRTGSKYKTIPIKDPYNESSDDSISEEDNDDSVSDEINENNDDIKLEALIEQKRINKEKNLLLTLNSIAKKYNIHITSLS